MATGAGLDLLAHVARGSHAAVVPHVAPVAAGIAVVALLGTLLARREVGTPCTSWRRRLLTTVAIVLCGLLTQELAAILAGTGHGADVGELAVHAGQAVLPLALLGGGVVALAIGVARVVGRGIGLVAPSTVALLTVPLRVAAAADALAPPGPLAVPRLAGRAPPLA